jgi:hypothetical protein
MAAEMRDDVARGFFRRVAQQYVRFGVFITTVRGIAVVGSHVGLLVVRVLATCFGGGIERGKFLVVA